MAFIYTVLDPQLELNEKFEDVDFRRHLLPGLKDLEAIQPEIAEQVGISRSYIGKIMREEKIPSLEYGNSIAEMAEVKI